MSEQMVFQRYEMKYMLTRAQREMLQKELDLYMVRDKHGKNTTLSLYLDTPDFLLARRSMEHPTYKEKLRLRSYGVADESKEVFVELKKKYESVVYKRRACMKERELETYLKKGVLPEDTQILREIDYAMKRYEGIQPAILLCYDREAFYGKENPDFRITFDENILWRDTEVDLTSGIYGDSLLLDDQVLMEIKVAAAYPKWLVDFLSDNKIYRTHYSKYANAFMKRRQK